MRVDTQMSRLQILSLYTWNLGRCFRCPDVGPQATAMVKELRTRMGSVEPIRACADCVLSMEEERRRAAEVVGAAYEPGRAGEPIGEP
jgi:hypothetical protein